MRPSLDRIIGVVARARESGAGPLPRPPADSRAVVVLGGASDIGLAIARELAARGASTVVLAGRNRTLMLAEAERFGAGVRVEALAFDARATDSHASTIEEAFALAGPVQAVVLAFAVLGDTQAFEANPALAGGASVTNFAGGVSASLAAARALERQAERGGGCGTLVVLSSAAVLRPRRENYVYGAGKAGLDYFARGLGESYRRRGVPVLVVRPGFVRTKMTAGMRRRPLETTAEAVATDVADALGRTGICWSPRLLRFAAIPLQLVPMWILRRVTR